jgi:hypothetical protein
MKESMGGNILQFYMNDRDTRDNNLLEDLLCHFRLQLAFFKVTTSIFSRYSMK